MKVKLSEDISPFRRPLLHTNDCQSRVVPVIVDISELFHRQGSCHNVRHLTLLNLFNLLFCLLLTPSFVSKKAMLRCRSIQPVFVVAASWSMVFRFVLLAATMTTFPAAAQVFDCAPPGNCVNRSSFHIRAIVHGTQSDPFWQQMQAAMFQAGDDMKVNFAMELYETFNSTVMAADVFAVGSLNPQPDALIVSIPDTNVQEAVRNLMQYYQLPVFGVNDGVQVANSIGMLGFVSIDDFLGGKMAGEYFGNATRGGGGNQNEPMKGLFVDSDGM